MNEIPFAVDNAEYLTDTELGTIQNQNWQQLQDYLRQHSAFYQRHSLSNKIPNAFADCPLTNKDMLRESQAGFPPFGDYQWLGILIELRSQYISGYYQLI